MTGPFTNILLADEGQSASPLTAVRASDLAAWLATLAEPERAWVTAHRFKAQPGEVLVYPGAGGAPAAVCGIPEGAHLGVWDLASAAARLPSAAYRLSMWGAAAGLGDSAIGWLLAHYEFTRYAPSRGGEPRRLLVTDFAGVAPAIAQATAIALVRDLVTTPSADMGPAELARAAQTLAHQHNAEFLEIVGDDLLAQNFPAIHAVGRASPRAPRLIDLRWGNPEHPRISLVGKGVCFDTGGYNLKPGSGMALMKKDMGGAAHVLALAHLIMAAGLPVRLRVLVPAVDNMIAGNAFVPGDVIGSRAGVSIEVTNTDAEGRLVLADALTLACEEQPELLLDFATLTGAARVAMGWEIPPMFTPDDALAAAFEAASRTVADPLWRLPLWPGYADMLASPIADVQNSPDSGLGGAITAALFLQKFVSVAHWAHFDVYAWMPTAKPGRPKGGEAMALRAAWHLIQQRFGAR